MAYHKTYRRSAVGVVLDVGVKRGNLTIIREVEPSKDSRNKTIHNYYCRCDCGNYVIKTDDTLKRGIRPNCGCNSAIKSDIQPRQRFGKLTVLRELDPKITPNGRKHRQFECKCDCGSTLVKSLDFLTHAKVPDCGCETPSRRRYGEMGQHRLYRIWRGMICRCTMENIPQYKNYGARGIKVCDEWSNNFKSFYTWAFENGYSDELTIDRIDVNGDYCPENCRWVSMQVQNFNKRSNHLITYDGETHPLKEWALIVGVNPENVYSRINKLGWSIGEALEFEPHAPRPKTSNKPRKRGYQRPSAWKAVCQLDELGNIIAEYPNVAVASKETGASTDNIRRCCYGTYKHTKGLFFKYKDKQ